ncbi:MAG: DUF3365 domain-containing protein [Rhodoferax sp.]
MKHLATSTQPFALRAAVAALVLLSQSTLSLAEEAAPVWLGQARQIATQAPLKLLKVLTDEIQSQGTAGAVSVCNVKAPQMAQAASKETGWSIRRVSLRNRNPKGVPDEWERAALEDFDRRQAAGESPTTLEKYAVVQGEGGVREARYIKALPVKQLCLACHGGADDIAPETGAKIRALYPQDKATGYHVDQIRGAITLRRPQ